MGNRFSNPIGFTPIPVTIISSLVYVALFVALLTTHLIVPSAPSNNSPIAGINLTEAWQDLQHISGGFHPYNSRWNDETRDWLLRRIERILATNTKGLMFDRSKYLHDTQFRAGISRQSPAVLLSDLTSNVTFSSGGKRNDSTSEREPGVSVYFEGTNIVVYIRGSEDGDQDWWSTGQKTPEKGGVLVNAHYDSVSTGYGATDDGVGVVSILQIIKHFTTEGNKPKKGIVALLNNGEEDYLNGARAFSQHPLSKFPRTFLNLEGAGAGGRAVMFRSTDTQVTKAYRKARYPFASVLSEDVFKRGIIRSQTDYLVFTENLGFRGLDIAFYGPRARYHTDQDDARHTSVDPLWHMLSASIPTLQALSSDASDSDSDSRGSDAIWFDLFGRILAVFELHTLFALSVALLVVAPLLLIAVGIVLYKEDKLYILSRRKQVPGGDDVDSVPLHGWKGFFQYLVLLLPASAAVIGLAFLMNKVNPFIVYSSPYAVWSMMLSAWFFVAWFLSCTIDFLRPSALTRLYSLLWLFVIGWIVLVAIAVLEKRQNIAGGYFIVFYFLAVFVATSLALLELFGLPRKSQYAEEVSPSNIGATPSHRSQSISSGQRLAQTSEEQQRPGSSEHQNVEEDEEATERTSLLRNNRHTTFAHYPHRNENPTEEHGLDETKERKVYLGEQAWSWSLPGWLWILQFLLLSVIPIILTGEIALLLTSSISQTLADGSSILLPYIAIAFFTILLLIPVSPFIHRYTYHIPVFLFLVFGGTLIYNLLAFPFSSNNRLKVYFDQRVDLDTGINTVSLTGIKDGPYLRDIAASLPSTIGHEITCLDSKSRLGLKECSWHGLPPEVVPSISPLRSGIPPEFRYAEWLSYNITHGNVTRNEAHITVSGKNTRACKLVFDTPISDFSVAGAAAEDERIPKVPKEGSKELRLWSRTWEKPWHIKVRWNGAKDNGSSFSSLGLRKQQQRGQGLNGRVVCLWSDANESGVIPALDEVWKYAPTWVAVSKNSDGLVEGSKSFLI
ncbi:MAG: hypothetical protein LQ343_000532 [Gyalolechia ehrenbergii]|nr:MAG: hypothetical protein LQ343_000532 [Gyalolechia ehrenbergii]